jgi:glycerophosphoryl diester phosphodiesterase
MQEAADCRKPRRAGRLTARPSEAKSPAVLLLAHRGASADAPENTLVAFQEAVAQGADGVELDAMVCGSGEVVVCHDERLDRLAGSDLWVRDTPLWKLKRLDVGSSLGFQPARIPLLEEVVDALPDDFVINIELKCEQVDDGGLAVKVGQLVMDRGLSERVVISSFNPLCLLRSAAAYPALSRGFLLDPDKPFLPQSALYAPLTSNFSIHPHAADCTARRAQAWHAWGRKIAAWTVDEPEEARRLQSLGVAYCITNRPAALRAALEEGS